MSTLLRKGRRRCDGTCHEAKGPVCRCICAGKHHGGKGTATARPQQPPLAFEPIDEPLDDLLELEDALDVGEAAMRSADLQAGLWRDS